MKYAPNRKKKPQKELAAHYQWVCVESHTLVEPYKRDDPPFCSRCHMTTGTMTKMKFARTVKRRTFTKKIK